MPQGTTDIEGMFDGGIFICQYADDWERERKKVSNPTTYYDGTHRIFKGADGILLASPEEAGHG